MPSLLVFAGITYMSLVKDAPIPMGDIPLADKWGHMLAYLVFTLCLAGDGYRAGLSPKHLYIWAIVLPVAYGGLIELIQPYFPPRQGEWTDWLANCIGTAVGIALFACFRVYIKRRNRRKHPTA